MDRSNSSTASKSSNKKPFNLMKSVRERKAYANELMEKFKGHIPIVLDIPKELDLDESEPNKIVLVGNSLKFVNFLEFLRKKVKLDEHSSLFLFANNNYLVKTSDLIGEVYSKYRNEDCFLYLKVSKKQVWG